MIVLGGSLTELACDAIFSLRFESSCLGGLDQARSRAGHSSASIGSHLHNQIRCGTDCEALPLLACSSMIMQHLYLVYYRTAILCRLPPPTSPAPSPSALDCLSVAITVTVQH